jgi:hypothetical protein
MHKDATEKTEIVLDIEMGVYINVLCLELCERDTVRFVGCIMYATDR